MGDVSICNRIFQQKGKQNLWALWFFVFFFSFPLLGKEAIGQETLICSLLLTKKMLDWVHMTSETKAVVLHP